MEFIPRFFSNPAQSFFLFGPRGTGKSTLIRKRFPDALYIDLLRPDILRTYAARPEQLIELIKGNPRNEWVVIDEIQRLPELLPVVHLIQEEYRDRRFILTGSSSRKLKRSGADLLAGRAVLRVIHPFMAAELANFFDLSKSLKNGLVPLVIQSENPTDTLRAYEALYIYEEVKMEGIIRDLGGFSRFLETISFSHGSVLNISNIARESQVKRKTVEGYLSVLEDLLISFRIPVFSRKAKRALISHPKFYLFDAGLFHILRPKGPLDYSREIEGSALEGLVAQHLRSWIDYRGLDNTLSYWRTPAGVEVDFIVYGEDGLVAIEVKNGLIVHPNELRHLRSFAADYPDSQQVLLYRGEDRLVVNDIPCLPIIPFLQRLRPESSLFEIIESD